MSDNSKIALERLHGMIETGRTPSCETHIERSAWGFHDDHPEYVSKTRYLNERVSLFWGEKEVALKQNTRYTSFPKRHSISDALIPTSREMAGSPYEQIIDLIEQYGEPTDISYSLVELVRTRQTDGLPNTYEAFSKAPFDTDKREIKGKVPFSDIKPVIDEIEGRDEWEDYEQDPENERWDERWDPMAITWENYLVQRTGPDQSFEEWAHVEEYNQGIGTSEL